MNDLNLSWDEIKKDLGKKEWKKILDENLKEMYDGNCWGVPSFKLLMKMTKILLSMGSR